MESDQCQSQYKDAQLNTMFLNRFKVQKSAYNVNIPFWILLLIEQMSACYMFCEINKVICFPY